MASKAEAEKLKQERLGQRFISKQELGSYVLIIVDHNTQSVLQKY